MRSRYSTDSYSSPSSSSYSRSLPRLTYSSASSSSSYATRSHLPYSSSSSSSSYSNPATSKRSNYTTPSYSTSSYSSANNYLSPSSGSSYATSGYSSRPSSAIGSRQTSTKREMSSYSGSSYYSSSPSSSSSYARQDSSPSYGSYGSSSSFSYYPMANRYTTYSSSSGSYTASRSNAGSSSSSSRPIYNYRPIKLRDRPLLTNIWRQMNTTTSSTSYDTGRHYSSPYRPTTLPAKASEPLATTTIAPTSVETSTKSLHSESEPSTIESVTKPSQDDQSNSLKVDESEPKNDESKWSSDISRCISRNRFIIKFKEIDRRSSRSPIQGLDADADSSLGQVKEETSTKSLDASIPIDSNEPQPAIMASSLLDELPQILVQSSSTAVESADTERSKELESDVMKQESSQLNDELPKPVKAKEKKRVKIRIPKDKTSKQSQDSPTTGDSPATPDRTTLPSSPLIFDDKMPIVEPTKKGVETKQSPTLEQAKPIETTRDSPKVEAEFKIVETPKAQPEDVTATDISTASKSIEPKSLETKKPQDAETEMVDKNDILERTQLKTPTRHKSAPTTEHKPEVMNSEPTKSPAVNKQAINLEPKQSVETTAKVPKSPTADEPIKQEPKLFKNDKVDNPIDSPVATSERVRTLDQAVKTINEEISQEQARKGSLDTNKKRTLVESLSRPIEASIRDDDINKNHDDKKRVDVPVVAQVASADNKDPEPKSDTKVVDSSSRRESTTFSDTGVDASGSDDTKSVKGNGKSNGKTNKVKKVIKVLKTKTKETSESVTSGKTIKIKTTTTTIVDESAINKQADDNEKNLDGTSKQSTPESQSSCTPKLSKFAMTNSQDEAMKLTMPSGPVSTTPPAAQPEKVHKRIRFRKYQIDDFNFISVLGHGGWGFVVLAELKQHDVCFAVKCIKKITIVEDDDFESILIERKVLLLGNVNPFICKLFCTFETEGYLFFVMEFCAGGDLMFHVQKEGKFTESRCRFYASEIICAIKFLHNKHIIYRDLKLDNILLDSYGHVRLVDFGMCQCRTYREEMLPSNFCGTPEYISPEIIKGVPYNHSVDWWSFGVLLYEMAVGKMPFRGDDENELLWNVCYEQIHYPMFLTRELTNLLQLLLEREPTKRMGMATCKAGDIHAHSWFRGVDWRAVEEMKVKPPFVPVVESNRDVQNFDTDFTESRPELSPVDESTLQRIDQSQFEKFPYTNPDLVLFDADYQPDQPEAAKLGPRL